MTVAKVTKITFARIFRVELNLSSSPTLTIFVQGFLIRFKRDTKKLDQNFCSEMPFGNQPHPSVYMKVIRVGNFRNVRHFPQLPGSNPRKFHAFDNFNTFFIEFFFLSFSFSGSGIQFKRCYISFMNTITDVY